MTSVFSRFHFATPASAKHLRRQCASRSLSALFVLPFLALGSLSALAQTSVTGLSSDGSIVTVTAPGGLQTPSLSVNGGGAGAIVLQQGTAQTAVSANSIQITAPTSVSTYSLTLPSSGPDASHPLLTFDGSGIGHFVAMPTTSTTSSVSTGFFNGAQTINGGNTSLPLVITSSNVNGSSIALDNSSTGGTYTLVFANGAKNTGFWDYTHFRDTFTCSQTDAPVSCGATHLVSTSAAPSITAGPGAGAGASVSFETADENAPSDQSGVIMLTTGGSPSSGSQVVTVTFNQPWARTIASQAQATNYAPACSISPANGAAASLTGTNTVYAGVASRSAFSLLSNSAPLPSNTTFAWTYKCM